MLDSSAEGKHASNAPEDECACCCLEVIGEKFGYTLFYKFQY